MDGTENTNTPTQGTETGAQTGQQNQQTGGAQQGDSQQQNQQQGDFITREMLQREVDRATNRIGNENKKLREQIEKLTKEHLTESERADLERQQEREQFERERAEFKLEKSKLFAIKAIEEAGLKDEKGSASALVDFVMADSEEAITARVKAFNALVESVVKARVDSIFKANGRTPGVGSGGSAKDNTDSLAVRMGKNAAQNNQKARSVLDHYIGGK